MPRHNGIDADRKQYKAQWHGSHMPLSAKHGAASATGQFDAVLQTFRTGSMRSWPVFCTRRRIKEQRNYVSATMSILLRVRSGREQNLIYAFRLFIADKVCAKRHWRASVAWCGGHKTPNATHYTRGARVQRGNSSSWVKINWPNARWEKEICSSHDGWMAIIDP